MRNEKLPVEDMPTMQAAEELKFSLLKIYSDRPFLAVNSDLIKKQHCGDLSKLLTESRQGGQCDLPCLPGSLALRMERFLVTGFTGKGEVESADHLPGFLGAFSGHDSVP